MPDRQGEGRREPVSGSPTTSPACGRCARRWARRAASGVDANGAWNLDEAEHAIHALAEFDLEYVEQPCASIEELAELRRRVKYLGIPIAADESVRKAADPIAVARAGAADIIVVKAQPLGGVRRALEIVAEAGLPAVVSSALETSIGLAMGVALAAALPELDYDCGLGTAALLPATSSRQPLVPEPGCCRSGGVSPDAALMRAVRGIGGSPGVVARAHRAMPLGARARERTSGGSRPPSASGSSMISCATRASSSLVRRHSAS